MRKDFYKSKQWIALRKWAISKYGAKCQKCGSVQDIQCDHVLPKSIYPGLALNKHNIGILCGSCNRKKAASVVKDYRPIRARLNWRLHKWTRLSLALLLVCCYLLALAILVVMTR